MTDAGIKIIYRCPHGVATRHGNKCQACETDAGERERLINTIAEMCFDVDISETKKTNKSFFKKCHCDPYDDGICWFCMNDKATKIADWILQNYTPKDKGREDA